MKIVRYLCLFLFTMISLFIGMKVSLDKSSAAENFPYTGTITADSLVVRSSPSGGNVTELVYGTRVTVIGVSGNYYRVRYTGGEGYVSSNYVINVDANTKSQDIAGVESYRVYCDSLKAKGFGESYCPYLYYLHSRHRNWIFTPNIVSATLENVAEREVEKVSLQTGNSNYWYYRNGVPLINERSSGGDYYYINPNTISSFLDPRNSLFEGTIFQFLNLEKNLDAVNSAALSKVSSSGNLSKYYNEFIKAGSATGVNAIHLMVRSWQEGADKVGYVATTGSYTKDTGISNPDGRTLDGFYNFYNIGSYVDSNNGYAYTVQRGLAYAAGYIGGISYQRPWDSPEKAVVGGGMWIGDQYVKKGQNTNYFQKFNVSSYSANSMFTHQYMTNAYAPTSEGTRLKSAYLSGGLLETGFEFVIPVYQNMRDNVYQAIDASTNSNLRSITVNGNLISGFEKDRSEYTYNIATNDNFVNVSATTIDSGAKVAGVGRIYFDGNNNASTTITVTAADGSKSVYTLLVKKVSAASIVSVDNIVSKMAVKLKNNIFYNISPGTTVDTLVNTVINNGGKASVTNKAGVAKNTGALATGDKITIKGTNDTKTYVVSVRGDTSGDGIVKINDLILVQSHILGSKSLGAEYLLAGDTNGDGVVKINDLILIQSYILGKGNL